jgi:hypothetical protein
MYFHFLPSILCITPIRILLTFLVETSPYSVLTSIFVKQHQHFATVFDKDRNQAVYFSGSFEKQVCTYHYNFTW